MQTLSDVVPLKTTRPPIDPGPPRLFPAIDLADRGRRLGLFSTFVDLATRNSTALPRLQQRSGLLPFFFEGLGALDCLPVPMAPTNGLEARRRILFFSLLVAEHPRRLSCWPFASMASRGQPISV